MILLEYTNFWA